MANAPKDKIIKLWYLRPYGFGWADYKGKKRNYVDYFLEDLALMIEEQGKLKALEKYLSRGKITAGNRQ